MLRGLLHGRHNILRTENLHTVLHIHIILHIEAEVKVAMNPNETLEMQVVSDADEALRELDELKNRLEAVKKALGTGKDESVMSKSISESLRLLKQSEAQVNRLQQKLKGAMAVKTNSSSVKKLGGELEEATRQLRAYMDIASEKVEVNTPKVEVPEPPKAPEFNVEPPPEQPAPITFEEPEMPEEPAYELPKTDPTVDLDKVRRDNERAAAEVQKIWDGEDVEIEIHTTADLSEAQKEVDRLEKAIIRNKNNIIRYQISGDTKGLAREERKLAANQAALSAFENAVQSADAAWEKFASGQIRIESVEDLRQAEKAAAALEKEIQRINAAMQRSVATGDIQGYEKNKAKMDKAQTAQVEITRAIYGPSESDLANIEEAKNELQGVQKQLQELEQAARVWKMLFGKKALKMTGSAEPQKLNAEMDALSERATQLQEKISGLSIGMDVGKLHEERANMEQLESVQKRMAALQEKLATAKTTGKTPDRNANVRKLQMDLTAAQKEAVKLQRSLGQISGLKAAAKNAGLTAKGLLQAKYNAVMLDKEARKANRTFVSIARVLSLMAVRMAVRTIIRLTKEGIQNLAQYDATFNASMSKMMSRVTQLKNSFATLMAPIINAVSPLIDAFLGKLSSVITELTLKLGALFGQTQTTIAVYQAEDYAKSLGKASDNASKLKKSLAGFDRFNLLGSPDSEVDDGKADPKLSFQTVDTSEAAAKFEPLRNAAARVAAALGRIFSGAREILEGLFDIPEGESVLTWLVDKLEGLATWLEENEELVSKLLVGLLGLLVLNKVVNVFMGLGNVISTLGPIISALTGPVGLVIAGFAAALAITGNFGAFIEELKTILGGLIDFVAGIFTGDWDRAWKGVGNIAIGIINGCVLLVESLINVIIKLANFLLAPVADIIADCADLLGFSINRNGFMEIPEVDFSGDLLPTFASGGMIPNTGQLFVANENGPELIGNLGGSTAVLNQDGIVRAVSQGVAEAVRSVMGAQGGSNNQPIQLQVQLNGEPIYKDVVRRHNNETRLRGRSPLTV